MYPQESIFTGIKIVDYRNARYQGLFNSDTQKKQGMGILIDDDMNIYCSEWEDGRMNGPTFVYLANGSYIYGWWKNNEPSGVNVYRNKEFILVGSYHRGANVGNTLAVTDSVNHMLIFNGQEIASRDKKKDLQLVSSESILEISLFEDIVFHTANKIGIQMNKNEFTLLSFLKSFSDKHNQYIQFGNRNGTYNFGFEAGLGFRFTVNGKVNHRINMASIGSIEDDRVTDFGVKFHETRCIEEGNFTLKQTITYNRTSERPRDKCLSIFQKNHKKALNFINQYFEYKTFLLSNLQWFLNTKLYFKHQENLKQQYDLRRLEKTQMEDKRQGTNELKEDLIKKSQIIKYERKNTMENKSPSKTIAKNRSSSMLSKKESIGNLAPYYNKERGYRDDRQEESEYNEYRQIQQELNQIFKKETICQRCKSKEKKRSQSKLMNQKPSKKSLEKGTPNSKSNQKINKQNNREIKYLVNYRPPAARQKSPMQKIQKSHTKSFTNLNKVDLDQNNKERLRVQNQIKIRKEIYDQQMQRDARNHGALNYPLTFPEFLAKSPLEESVNINSFSPSSRVIKTSKVNNPALKYNYIYPNHENSQFREKSINDMNIENMISLGGVSSIKKIEELQNRRDRILREFKELNTDFRPSANFQKQLTHNSFLKNNNTKQQSPPQIFPKYREVMDERSKISQFNKKYRNYLYGDNKPIEKRSIDHDIGYAQSPVRQPYVASFIHSPAKRDSSIHTPERYQFSKQSEGRKRYQYFFENSHEK